MSVAVVVGVVVAVGAFVVLRSEDRTVWKLETRNAPDRLVADDTTVCGSDHRRVFCFDAATGDELFRAPRTHLAAVLSISEETLLAGFVPEDPAQDTEIRAYTPDGRELWRISGNYSYDMQLPVIDGVVVAPDDGFRSVQGLELATGEPVWEAPYPAPSNGIDAPDLTGPTLTDGESVYSSMVEPGPRGAPQLVAVDPTTGAERWKTTIGEYPDMVHVQQAAGIDGSDSTALVVGAIASDRRLLVVDRATGEITAELPLGEGPADLVTVDGTIVVLTGEQLRGYSPDGDELWTQTVPVGRMTAEQKTVLYPGSLQVVDGTLYLDTTSVWTIDPANGERTGTIAEEGVGAFVATSDLVFTADGCCPLSGTLSATLVEHAGGV